MPWNVDANRPLAHTLYRRLVQERNPSVQLVSRCTGIPETTLRGWCEGVSAVPAWAIPVIARVAQDPVFFAELTGSTEAGFLVFVRTTETPTTKSLQATSAQATAECGRLGLSVTEAVDDDIIDRQELRRIQLEIDQAERYLERLRSQALLFSRKSAV